MGNFVCSEVLLFVLTLNLSQSLSLSKLISRYVKWIRTSVSYLEINEQPRNSQRPSETTAITKGDKLINILNILRNLEIFLNSHVNILFLIIIFQIRKTIKGPVLQIHVDQMPIVGIGNPENDSFVHAIKNIPMAIHITVALNVCTTPIAIRQQSKFILNKSTINLCR